ncbi:hypothetical protein F5884DRAFT_868352 [Xylogone sp. PMI_703]|nr:hypothetical protein F5884DRAFT_868352 [Xylogone sp. PMI_703]
MMEQSDDANLLEKLIEANGGLDYYNSIDSISTTMLLSGPVLALKGYPGVHEFKLTVHIKTQKVEFEKFEGFHGTYTPTRTQLRIIGSNSVSTRDNPRDAFRDHDITTKWDKHNLLYFTGYAFWYYFNLPFLLVLPGLQVQELSQHQPENGEIWRVLQVTFPDNFATHTKVQQLYFDEKYRLRRMDYRVDISTNKPVSHFCYDHQVCDKIIIPTFRLVQLSSPGESHITAFALKIQDTQINKTPIESGAESNTAV